MKSEIKQLYLIGILLLVIPLIPAPLGKNFNVWAIMVQVGEFCFSILPAPFLISGVSLHIASISGRLIQGIYISRVMAICWILSLVVYLIVNGTWMNGWILLFGSLFLIGNGGIPAALIWSATGKLQNKNNREQALSPALRDR